MSVISSSQVEIHTRSVICLDDPTRFAMMLSSASISLPWADPNGSNDKRTRDASSSIVCSIHLSISAVRSLPSSNDRQSMKYIAATTRLPVAVDDCFHESTPSEKEHPTVTCQSSDVDRILIKFDGRSQLESLSASALVASRVDRTSTTNVYA